MVSDFGFDVNNFKMVAIASFHAELCCHLVNAHTPFARHLYGNAYQFLIYSTLGLLVITVLPLGKRIN